MPLESPYLEDGLNHIARLCLQVSSNIYYAWAWLGFYCCEETTTTLATLRKENI